MGVTNTGFLVSDDGYVIRGGVNVTANGLFMFVVSIHKYDSTLCQATSVKIDTTELSVSKSLTAEKQHSSSTIPPPKIVASGVHLDITTGRTFPYFLLQVEERHFSLYYVRKKKIKLLETYNAKNLCFSPDDDVLMAVLTDGPCINFITKSSIHFHCSLGEKLKSFDIPETENYKPSWCGVVGQHLTLFLSRKKESNTNNDFQAHEREKRFTVYQMILKSGDDVEFINLETEKIFHDIYQTVLNTFIVDMVDMNQSDTIVSQGCHGDGNGNVTVGHAMRVIMYTTSHQLIEFINGRMTQCVTLSSSHNASSILVFKNSVGKDFIVLHDQDHKVVILHSETFKIEQTIEGISNVCVGDFICCGTEQLLLLHDQTSASQTEDRISIKDFGFHDCGYCIESEDKDIAANLHSAVTALQNTYQVNLQILDDKRRQIQRQNGLIQESCEAIQSMSLWNKHTTKPKNYLVNLANTQDANMQAVSDVTAQVNEGKDRFKVNNKWQKVVNGRWVVAAEITNISDRCLFNVGLSLVCGCKGAQPRAHETVCSSKVLKKETNVSHSRLSPVPKRKKIAETACEQQKETKNLDKHESVTLVAHTNVPSFKNEKLCTVILVLNWHEEIIPQHHSIEPCTKSGLEQLDMSFVCGEISMDVKSFLTSKYSQLHCQDGEQSGGTTDAVQKVVEARKTKLCLDATQTKYTIVIKTELLNISEFGAFYIQNGLNFLWQGEGQIWFHPGFGLFYLCRICVKESRKHAVTIEIYTQEVEQCILIIHALKDLLPDDVIFENLSKANKESEAMTAICKELTNTCDNLKSIISEAEAEFKMSDKGQMNELGYSPLKANDKLETLVEFRQNFNLRKEKSFPVTNCLVSHEKYQNFKKQLLSLQTMTDRKVQDMLNDSS